MDVFVDVVRHVVVDDVGHAGDVEAPGSHGSRHQDGLVAGAEVEERLLALALEAVAVDAGGGQPLAGQVGRQEVGVLLGLDEDKRPLLRITIRVLGRKVRNGRTYVTKYI